MCLHFNFQAMFIIFPACVALVWCLLGVTVDYDLFTLGTRKFGTPREFEFGGMEDTCKVCQTGYYRRQSDGQCYSTYIIPILVLTVVLLLLVGAIGFWIYDMAKRPITNPDGLKLALTFRENSKLHQPKVPGHTRKQWPITKIGRAHV